MIDAQAGDDVAVVLVVIEHPDLLMPLRISSDNKDRISVEPLTYGTFSTYADEDGLTNPFYWTGMLVIPPDEEDGGEPQATLLLDVLDTDIVKLLTSTIVRASCRMAIVMASTPDLVEYEFDGLEMGSANGDWGQVGIKFTMANLYDEPYPWARTTKELFPGLHR